MKANGLDVRLHDVRAEPLSRATLQTFLDAFDEDVINRRSTTWRALSDEERSKNALDLLETYPPLMKRPVIATDGTLYLGWTDRVQAELMP